MGPSMMAALLSLLLTGYTHLLACFQAQRFYFPNLTTCFSGAAQVEPA